MRRRVARFVVELARTTAVPFPLETTWQKTAAMTTATWPGPHASTSARRPKATKSKTMSRSKRNVKGKAKRVCTEFDDTDSDTDDGF